MTKKKIKVKASRCMHCRRKYVLENIWNTVTCPECFTAQLIRLSRAVNDR